MTNNLGVLMIDMQEIYLTNVRKKERLMEAQSKVLKICEEKDIPVGVLEMKDRGKTDPYLNSLIEKVPRNVTIEKPEYDGFLRTGLYDKLSELGINRGDSIYFMGVYARACVKDTARTARDLGFKIATSQDVIANESDLLYFLCPDKWYSENGIQTSKYSDIEEFS